MNKTVTCIICPKGCEVSINLNGEEILIYGAGCKRGESYALEECMHPKRNVATSVRVLDGHLPLASVRLTEPIPKEYIEQAIDEIKRIKMTAPCYIGDIVLTNILGMHSDVVITRDVMVNHERGGNDCGRNTGESTT